MVTIRAAQPSDAPGIAHVRTLAWQHAYRGLLSDSLLDSLDESGTARSWAKGLADLDRSRDEVLVAVDGDLVCGFARLGGSRDADADTDSGELWALYVLPARAGSGIGGALHDGAIAWLRGAGFGEHRLWTLEGNGAAQRFYRSRGWAADGARRERDIGEPAVEIRMTRTPLG